METRLIIAYLLITFMLMSAIVFAKIVLHRRRERRRLMRGQGGYKRRSEGTRHA